MQLKNIFLKYKNYIIIIFMSFFIISLIGTNIVSAIEWKKYESDNFLVFYPENYDFQAKETIYYLEKEKEKIVKLTGNNLSEKVVVVVEDRGQFSNGYADNINNKIGIFTYPPGSNSSLAPYENWYEFLTIHELTHLGHLTNTSEMSSILQYLHGNLLSPNLHSPIWLIEGTAVYSESDFSGYTGRLNSSYYDAIFKAKSATNNLPSLSEITYNHNHFPRDYQYLYGAKFIEYLSLEFGEEKLADLFDTYGSYFWSPFIGDVFPMIGLDMAAKKTYDSSFATLYKEWKDQVEKTNKKWEINGEKLIEKENGYITNLTSNNNGKIYYFLTEKTQVSHFNYRKINKLIEYDITNNEEKVIKRFLANNYGTLKIKNDKLYYLLSDIKKGFNNLSNDSYGTYTTLFCYNLQNGETKKIVSDEIRDFVVINDKKIIYSLTDRNNFGTKIIKYEDDKKVMIGSIPLLITEMKKYKDKIITVSKEKNSSWDIYYLNYKNLNIKNIINTPYAEKMISLNGDNLLFTANYGGNDNIYQLNLETNKKEKLTNSDYAANGVITKDKLYFTSYYNSGMRIYNKSKKGINYVHEEINREDKIFIKKDFDLVEKNKKVGYKNLKYLLKPGIRFIPFFVTGEDPLGYNNYQILLSPYGGYNIYYENNYLNPFRISIDSYLNKNQRQNEIEFYYPLYRSQQKGLTEINTSLSTDFSNYINSIDFEFSYPLQDFIIDLDYDFKNSNYVLKGKYNYYLSNSKLSLGLERYDGLKKPTDIREIIPDIYFKSGYKYSIGYNSKLFEIRKGSWNPNLFIGDIYGKIFLDYNHSDSLDYKKLSAGGEFIFESGIGNWIHLAPRLGISISENERKFYFGF